MKYRYKELKGKVRRNALNAAVIELLGKMMKFTVKNAALLWISCVGFLIL